jgi:hypothetical protein
MAALFTKKFATIKIGLAGDESESRLVPLKNILSRGTRVFLGFSSS